MNWPLLSNTIKGNFITQQFSIGSDNNSMAAFLLHLYLLVSLLVFDDSGA